MRFGRGKLGGNEADWAVPGGMSANFPRIALIDGLAWPRASAILQERLPGKLAAHAKLLGVGEL